MLCTWRQFHDRLREAAIESALIDAPLAILVAEIRALEPGDGTLLAAIIELFVDHAGADGSVVRCGPNLLTAILPHAPQKDATARAEAFRSAVQVLGVRRHVAGLDCTVVATSGYDPDEPLGQLVERAFGRLRSTSEAEAQEA